MAWYQSSIVLQARACIVREVFLIVLLALTVNGELQFVNTKWILVEMRDEELEIISVNLRGRAVDFGSIHSAEGPLWAWVPKVPKPDTVGIYYTMQELVFGSSTLRIGSTGSGCHSRANVHALETPAEADTLIAIWDDGRRSELPLSNANYASAKFRSLQSNFSAGPAQRIKSIENLNGPVDSTKNIVFLSAGYAQDERHLFMAAVSFVIQFVRGNGPQGFKDSGVPGIDLVPAPMNRYFDLMNIYAVFEPSLESGITIPKKSDGTDWDGYPAREIRNNLKCTYGTDVLRYLHCDRTLALNLAFKNVPAAPENTLIHVIANSELYGGTANDGMDYIYSGKWLTCVDAPSGSCIDICKDITLDYSKCGASDKVQLIPARENQFINVFIHEQGHSDAGLRDEYDQNAQGDPSLVLSNCVQDPVNSPWKHWIANPIGVGQPSRDQGSCTYNGYYKPTTDLCLMNSKRSEMCAACAERAALGVYKHLKNLATPRAPRENETMVVLNDDTKWYLGVRSTFFQGPVLLTRPEITDPSSSNQKAQSTSNLKGSYPFCSTTKTMVKSVLTNIGSDDPTCSVDGGTFGRKVPIRVDVGDIEHTWFWPSTARSPPTANRTRNGDGLWAQNWRRTSDGWSMTGHVENTFQTTIPPVERVSIPVLEFTGEQLGCGKHIFKFNVVDKTTFVNTKVFNLTRANYTTTFVVLVLGTGCTNSESEYPLNMTSLFSHCTGDLSTTYSDTNKTALAESFINVSPLPISMDVQKLYCGVCASGSICNESYPSQPFQATADLAVVLDGLEKKLVGVVGGCIGGGFLLILLATLVIANCTSAKGDEKIPLLVRIGRWVLMAMAILIMIESVIVIIFGVYYYQKYSVYGKTLIIFLGAVHGIFFIVGWVGFAAAFFKSKPILSVSGFLWIMLLGLVIAVLVVTTKVQKSIKEEEEGKSNDFTRYIEDQWVKQVNENPKVVCSFESRFSCSGLTSSCSNKYHKQCPKQCELTNQEFPDPCYGVFKKTFKSYVKPIIAVAAVFLVVVILGLTCIWGLCCVLLWQKKRSTKVQNKTKGAVGAMQIVPATI